MILYEERIRLVFCGNDVYCTNSLILLVKNMMCSKLHCQKGSSLIPFSYKILEERVAGTISHSEIYAPFSRIYALSSLIYARFAFYTHVSYIHTRAFLSEGCTRKGGVSRAPSTTCLSPSGKSARLSLTYAISSLTKSSVSLIYAISR